jgi:hypothetical protein
MSVWSAYAEIQRTVPGADLAFSLQDFLHRCSACAQYTIVESAANAVKRTRLARFSSLRLECFSILILRIRTGPDTPHTLVSRYSLLVRFGSCAPWASLASLIFSLLFSVHRYGVH